MTPDAPTGTQSDTDPDAVGESIEIEMCSPSDGLTEAIATV